jgi:hypothetical protein
LGIQDEQLARLAVANEQALMLKIRSHRGVGVK